MTSRSNGRAGLSSLPTLTPPRTTSSLAMSTLLRAVPKRSSLDSARCRCTRRRGMINRSSTRRAMSKPTTARSTPRSRVRVQSMTRPRPSSAPQRVGSLTSTARPDNHDTNTRASVTGTRSTRTPAVTPAPAVPSSTSVDDVDEGIPAIVRPGRWSSLCSRVAWPITRARRQPVRSTEVTPFSRSAPPMPAANRPSVRPLSPMSVRSPPVSTSSTPPNADVVGEYARAPWRNVNDAAPTSEMNSVGATRPKPSTTGTPSTTSAIWPRCRPRATGNAAPADVGTTTRPGTAAVFKKLSRSSAAPRLIVRRSMVVLRRRSGSAPKRSLVTTSMRASSGGRSGTTSTSVGRGCVGSPSRGAVAGGNGAVDVGAAGPSTQPVPATSAAVSHTHVVTQA